MKRPTEQIYSNYTTEDFAVWKTLYDRQMDILQSSVARSYLDALDKVNFRPNHIPDFKEVDNVLIPATGWSMEVVPNICPQKEFFQFLSAKKFTATCWLRTMQQLDYLEEPDMFHDVFGHVPLLSNPAYCDFFRGISNIALEFIDNPAAIDLLSRVYWFTIEFGMIREKDEVKIYGAGIISSHAETLNCLNEQTHKLDYDVALILNTPYRNDIIQDKYFVMDSFDQLHNSLPEIRSCLAGMLGDTTPKR
jgi:phenylalanine-4-hydroxylase